MHIIKPATYIILGDVHIHPDKPKFTFLLQVFSDVIVRLKSGENLHVILNGDFFDFVLLPGTVFTSLPVIESLDRLDNIAPEIFDKLYEIVNLKSKLIFLAGNHDQELFLKSVQDKILQLIGKRGLKPSKLKRVEFPLWFYRPKEMVHIEHGSQYDPDNSVIHPLLIEESADSVALYPLGVLMGKWLRNTLGDKINDFSFKLDQNGAVKAIIWAAKEYKWRILKMGWHFIGSAEKIIRLSKKHSEPNDQYVLQKESRFATNNKLSPSIIKTISSLMALPTVVDPVKTRQRFFLNRMYLSLLLIIMVPSWFIAPILMGPLAGVGLIPLFGEFRRQKKYISGEATRQMTKAAIDLKHKTNVQLVILSHIHKNLEEGKYLNTGSLELPKEGFKHSYLELTIRRKHPEWKFKYLS